ncbi:MAG: hypothetical protein PHQ47_02145 [Candidatus Portnoybacteria bacterium]|nr:hypothetical protein [Candidatus Portnoybacteria bacterium]
MPKKKKIFLSAIVFLILLGAAGFKFGFFKKDEKPKEESASLTENGSAANLNPDEYRSSFSEKSFYELGRSMLGSWRQDHPESSVCPQDAYEINFSINEKGKLIFESWLHCRSFENGVWKLDGDTITVTVGGQETQNKIYIDEDGALWFGNHGEFKRSAEEFSETESLLPLWDKFFAPSAISFDAAKIIAQKSDCAKEGKIAGSWFYNQNTLTWWFDMDIKREGCSPACVVSEETRSAEINWRCTGILIP